MELALEKEEIAKDDCETRPIEELSKQLNEIDVSSSQLCGLVDSLKEKIKSSQLDTTNGISLLDVKNQMMLSYMTNIVYVIAKKCFGQSIEGDQAIDRLVEMRTVVERIRPLEHKLKYMMEKLVKAALTGVTNDNDPTHFRANPSNMVDNEMGESETDSDKEKEEKPSKKKEKSGVYVPPRLAPMHYDEEDNTATRRQKQLERAKKRALHSSVIEELKEEYLDTPVEISHGNTVKAVITKHQRHKNQYEEENFTRLPTSKKDKQRSRHSMTVGNIADQLTHFDNIQVLEDDEAFTSQAKRKRKSTSKNAKKKGFKRRKTQ